MAIGWLKVIQSVPWSDVISNAPKVAEGAKGLWDRVSKKGTPGTEDNSDDVAPIFTTPLHTSEQLQNEVFNLRNSQMQLETQMLEATNLINSLAQQNQDMVQRLNRLQSKLRWAIGLWVLALFVLFTFVALKWFFPNGFSL